MGLRTFHEIFLYIAHIPNECGNSREYSMSVSHNIVMDLNNIMYDMQQRTNLLRWCSFLRKHVFSLVFVVMRLMIAHEQI